MEQHCFYQTPAMRVINPDFVLPGLLVESGENVAIQKPNGKFLTVLHDGTDAEHDVVLDQETFRPPPARFATPHAGVVVADRTMYPEGQAYTVSVFLVEP
jgi:hypothetical protein